MITAHIAARADLLHRRLEVAMNLRIFVLELDLPAAEFHAGKGSALAVLRAHEAIAPVVPAQGQIASRVGAGVEMLMKPLIRRHHHAARFPIDALRLFTLRPEHRIALPTENDHMGARTMLVALFIGAYREFGDMRAHGVFRQVELHIGAALAALAVVGELERMGVGHEVGGEKKPPGELALPAEIAFGARVEAVEKSVVAVENVIG